MILLVGRARAVLAALFAAGHVGMALTLQLGIFPLVSVVALVPFLPASAWDRLPTRRAEDLGERIADPLDASLPRGRLAGRVPALPRVRRRLATPLLASLVAVLILWNAAAVGVLAAPSEVQSVTRDRTWDMFAPAPPQADGWYVAAGRLDSGRKVDALRGGALRSGPPPNAAQTYPTSRWRKYLDALRGNAALRPPLAGYLCDRWDRTRDGDLATVSLSYVRQPTRFDGPEPIERVELGTYACEGDGLTASEARNGTTGTQEPSDHRAEGRV